MTRPRKVQVCKNDTPYYHCVSRCVRRAFLCGSNTITGECFEHRRQWIVDRIRLLSSIFAVDICSYAVMSNHYHIVLKLNCSEEWSDKKVIQLWLTLFKGPLLVQNLLNGHHQDQTELNTIKEIVAVWRERLQDLSWFMKCLNEPIARMANSEDNCSGHFWEARFKSQALLSEEALLSCMAYVDLNPVRAAMAVTPENSDYTSIQERIKPTFDLSEAIHKQNINNDFNLPIKPLLHFDDNFKQEEQAGIPFVLSEYLQLIDFTGRIIRDDKRGFIPNQMPIILSRLDIPIENWLSNSQNFEKVVYRQFRKAA